MRYAILIVLVGLLGLGFVLHERKGMLERNLGQVASVLAERPVKVHCKGVARDLVDVDPNAGWVPVDANGKPKDSTTLDKSTCNALRRFRGDAKSDRLACVLANTECSRRAFDDVVAVKVLAHESWHLRGTLDEAVTECRSMQTTAQAALLLGADAEHAQAVARYAWTHVYPHMPSDYRTFDCYDGGPLDLRPADPSWP